jgi:hypothetical protein
VYQRVLEGGLRQFFEKRYGDHLLAARAIAFLAQLAHYMLSRSEASISNQELLRIAESTAKSASEQRGVIEPLVTAALLERSANRFSFRHPAYRSYFCAVYLKGTGTWNDALQLSRDATAKDALRFYVGIAGEDAAAAFLTRLFKRVRRWLWVLRVGGSRRVSDRLFLLLWCLADAAHPHAVLKARLLKSLRKDWMWLLLGLRFGARSASEHGLRLHDAHPSLWDYPRIACDVTRV